MTKIKELDLVALRHDIPEKKLKQGDVGTVVHCYKREGVYEVEFIADNGMTIATLTLTDTDVWLLQEGEVLISRALR